MRSSYSNRGMGLEKMILLFGCRYLSSGKAYLIQNEPSVRHIKTLRNGQFVAVRQSKGQPDFIIHFNRQTVLFDAKEFHGRRFSFSSLSHHQFLAMQSFERCGGHSALFMRAKDTEEFFVLPFSTFQKKYQVWFKNKCTDTKTKKGEASLSLAFIRENGFLWNANGYIDALMEMTQRRKIHLDPMT